VLIYDGDCGFCTMTASWVSARLRVPISVVPWQEIADLGELGLSEAEVTTAAYWVDAYGRLDRGHRAVGRALTMTSGPLVLAGWLLLVPPISWLAAVGYPLVSRYRHKLPGATAACAIRA
jgi:predicted DCC family thiol-disulfide oxidoreductase YuxK